MGGVDGVKVAVKHFVEGFALVAAVEEEEEGEKEDSGYACGERRLARKRRKGKGERYTSDDSACDNAGVV